MYEGIEPFFPADGGSSAVARIHDGSVGQIEQFLFNAFNEQRAIAVVEIAAAHGPGEKRIARKTMTFKNERASPGSVPRYVQHLAFEAANPLRSFR